MENTGKETIIADAKGDNANHLTSWKQGGWACCNCCGSKKSADKVDIGGEEL